MKYKSILMYNPDLEEQAQDKLKEDFKEILKKYEINILEEQTPEKKTLFHPIKKKEEVNFYILYFEADPLSIEKIRKDIRHDERILRYMILKEI